MKGNQIVLEAVEIGAKTALSIIPVGGTLVSCVWDSVKANAAQKRMEAWKNLLEERLHKIEITLEDVGNNELFTSAMMKATDAAIRTAEETKREYLANVVNNTLIIPIEESILMMFLDMIDHLTALHLSILRFFQDPSEGGKNSADHYYAGSPSRILQDAHPEWVKDMGIISKAVRDLQADGLLQQGEFMNVIMSGQGMISPRITDFGNSFLRYISK